MKIYNVEFENKKYSGASIERISVQAGSIAAAIAKAQKIVDADAKAGDISGGGWEPVSAEKIAETR